MLTRRKVMLFYVPRNADLGPHNSRGASHFLVDAEFSCTHACRKDSSSDDQLLVALTEHPK